MKNFDLKKYLVEGKLTEAYTPGEGWTADFEYDDMIAHGLTLTADDSIEDLRKVVEDFTDVNYHREAAHLYDAIDAIEAGNRGEAKMYINKFRKEIAKLQESEIKERKPIVKNKTKMKKSELKEMIKMALSEGDNYYEDSMDEAATEVFTDAELDMASEMLMGMFDKLGLENNVEKSDALAKYINSWFENLNFVNEAEEVDVEDNEEVTAVVDTDDPKSPILKKLLKKHKVTMVAAPGFGKFKLTGLRKDIEAVLQSEDGWGINDLHNYIKEAEEEVDVDIEKDVEIDDESVESDIEVKGSMPGEDADEVAVQSLLMKAQEEAAKLGDEKLTDQIGNTITYFTRAHVATVDEDVNEETDYDNTDAVSGDINVTNDNPAADAEIGLALNEEVDRFKKLAGIIK